MRVELSAARVVEAVDRPHTFPVAVRVALGRLDRGVSEELLHTAQVRARLDQVARERVPEGVGRDARWEAGGARAVSLRAPLGS